ncbi:galactokinase [Bifidobacterium magnum]|uniref:Galactokinase n=1 Tax=Bifidobacterium magnum TaxID=1692 RepID=A0A087BF08_9BIFI|nr:galactokinase [Bifidobacterium magnum]KFI69608.1 Galactokinase [Bifidobacterium magnum]
MSQVEFIEPLTDAEGSAKAADLFTEAFGEQPSGVWAAPGRANLIGEHTDYNAGLCLPIALPHRTYIALKPRTDLKVRLVSDVNPADVEEVDLEGLEAKGVEGWAAYPAGVAWAMRKMGLDTVRGFDAAFASCVPLGSGLSSSAAMTCSTALALDDVFGLGYGNTDEGRVTLIESAIMSENDMAGASTGGLDQNASMRCKEGYALRLDCRPELNALENVRQEPFDLGKYGLELLVLDTQAPHQLNDGQYAERRSMCEQAAELLGVANLREVADKVNSLDDPAAGLDEVLAKLPSEVMKKRVRHVITEIGRVDDFIEAFANGDVKLTGELLNASGDSLRYDYEVTVPELDVAVDTARANGAYGARMMGGGFGGSIIAIVDAGKSQEIAQKIADAFEQHGFNAPRALPAYAAAAATRVQ